MLNFRKQTFVDVVLTSTPPPPPPISTLPFSPSFSILHLLIDISHFANSTIINCILPNSAHHSLL